VATDPKHKKPVNRKAFVVASLRRASLKWPPRNEAMRLARVKRGLYKCKMCSGLYRSKEIDIDHIIPVVSLRNGFTNWDDYIINMLPDVDGFQILCKTCHLVKTNLEDTMRDKFSKSEKKNVRKSKKTMAKMVRRGITCPIRKRSKHR
jgi:hypothetical protein